ncbi:MAG TPA: hypothetical protein VFA42_08965 [Gaiellaceae bacterium]|jgi:hypothetical protein|nr:hypothetical protein [Gaiellaceae bacterium]
MLFLLCVSAALGAHGREAGKAAGRRSSRLGALHYLEGRLRRYEQTTWYWERLTGAPLTETAGRTLSAMDVPDLRRTVARWERRALKAHRTAQHPPHMAQWMCIHHYEAAWNDVGSPYWGGLQMSLTFQERYGGWIYRMKGTADHWTPLEQIWTAEKALKSRGFWPWPNTARLCGLI